MTEFFNLVPSFRTVLQELPMLFEQLVGVTEKLKLVAVTVIIQKELDLVIGGDGITHDLVKSVHSPSEKPGITGPLRR